MDTYDYLLVELVRNRAERCCRTWQACGPPGEIWSPQGWLGNHLV